MREWEWWRAVPALSLSVLREAMGAKAVVLLLRTAAHLLAAAFGFHTRAAKRCCHRNTHITSRSSSSPSYMQDSIFHLHEVWSLETHHLSTRQHSETSPGVPTNPLHSDGAPWSHWLSRTNPSLPGVQRWFILSVKAIRES